MTGSASSPRPARPDRALPHPVSDRALPHPVSRELFTSPVPSGSGWPGDPATPATPIAHDAAAVQRLAAGVDLPTLDARISVCRACPRLVEWREEVARVKRAAWRDEPYWGRPAPGFGDEHPQVLVVGLAPAAHGANRTGRMFTGDRSGDWLYAALHRAGYASQATSLAAGDGLTLRGLRIIATARCAPPQNKLTPSERATCSGWLDHEVALLTAELSAVLALGSVGWDAFLACARRLGWDVPRPKPRFGHGAVAELSTPQGRPIRLVGSYHVSQQNTFTGTLTEPMLDAAIAKLKTQADGDPRHNSGASAALRPEPVPGVLPVSNPSFPRR
ncbi:MAG: uracil-DNA glycosylase [Micrococcales bacterium]|nr:uracil-DNA glycosylase [Micrococcales bacterium]